MLSPRKIRLRIDRALRSSRGKDAGLYLLCVCIAFVFWVLLSLDSEVQRDYEVPVELTGVPDSVTVINSPPRAVSVTVQGKGSQLLRFNWGRMPVMKIDFASNVAGRSLFLVTKPRIDGRLRDYFGQGVSIGTVKPDSIRLEFTTMPGVRLPLVVCHDLQPGLQSVISGPVTASADSVTVYALGGVPANLTHVETAPVVRSGIADTLRIEAAVKPIPGMRIIPDHVLVTVPVEPLIAKTRQVYIERLGLPGNVGMITFPTRVEVRCLVPMSRYKNDIPAKAYVDYSGLNKLTRKAKVHLGALPKECINATVTPDSVEYIIEYNND